MQPGERVAGRFEILGEAARGGMGTVFRAHDRRHRRDVALKLLRSDAVIHGARFEREAALLAGLHHPGVVEYISHGATPDGLRYLVMAWVEGETLAHRLARGGLAGSAVIAMAIQLCRALDALHRRGVVHRDVKPSNLMLAGGDPGRTVLVDLGIARRADGVGRLTRTGAVVGTPGYLAPELVRGGRREVDGRADLFALGCVLHECFAGEPAFRADTTLATCAKVLLHDPPPLRALDPAIPEALDALVSALLARRPDQRPASAAAVERALAALPAVARAPRRAGPPPAAPRTTRRTAGPLCGIVIVWPGGDVDPQWLLELGGDALAFDVFDHGAARGAAIVVEAGPARAATLGLAIAGALPDAVIAVAPGDTPGGCVERGARLLAEIELAAQVSGTPAAGVWLERAAGAQLSAQFEFAACGAHVRIAGDARCEAA